jgi:tRNA(fMet)-specific endonuclease VapC
MAPRYVLDTNICIYIAKRRPIEVLRRFEQLEPGAAAISVVTWGELLFGAERSVRRPEALAVLEEFRTVLAVLAMADSVGVHYAAIRGDLARRGEPIGNNDLWIASHVRDLGAVLVTNNTREFLRVPGLIVENWAG